MNGTNPNPDSTEARHDRKAAAASDTGLNLGEQVQVQPLTVIGYARIDLNKDDEAKRVVIVKGAGSLLVLDPATMQIL